MCVGAGEESEFFCCSGEFFAVPPERFLFYEKNRRKNFAEKIKIEDFDIKNTQDTAEERSQVL